MTMTNTNLARNFRIIPAYKKNPSLKQLLLRGKIYLLWDQLKIKTQSLLSEQP